MKSSEVLKKLEPVLEAHGETSLALGDKAVKGVAYILEKGGAKLGLVLGDCPMTINSVYCELGDYYAVCSFYDDIDIDVVVLDGRKQVEIKDISNGMISNLDGYNFIGCHIVC